MHKVIRIGVLLALAALVGSPGLRAQSTPDTSKWEPEIAAFEASDKTNPPPKHGILFLGSSSIRMWKTLVRDFPDKPVLNRGFGGSHIEDSTALAERIVFPYEPKLIVFYAGDNDLADGKSPGQVVADFKALVKKVETKLPETKIVFISVKPSPLRWALKDKMQAVNREIEAMKSARLSYVDVWPAMIGADGQPRAELYLSDRLHMTAKGYELWVPLVKKYLE